MAAGEAEAAAAVVALEGPGDDLAAARMLLRRRRAAHLIGWDRFQDRGYLLRFRREAEVEVPFVLNFKRLDAARDGVLRHGFEVGLPVRVGRVARFVVPA